MKKNKSTKQKKTHGHKKAETYLKQGSLKYNKEDFLEAIKDYK